MRNYRQRTRRKKVTQERIAQIRAELLPTYQCAAPMNAIIIEPDGEIRATVAIAIRTSCPTAQISSVAAPSEVDLTDLGGAGTFAWLGGTCDDGDALLRVSAAIACLDPCPGMVATVAGHRADILDQLVATGVQCFPNPRQLLEDLPEVVRLFKASRELNARAAYRAACCEQIVLELSDEAARAAGYYVAPANLLPLDQHIRAYASRALSMHGGNYRATWA